MVHDSLTKIVEGNLTYMPKRYDYFDHKADVGIIGIGRTLPGAFEQAARAMFDLMHDVEREEPLEEIRIECEADSSEEMFVEWLNALLVQANMHELALGEFQVRHQVECLAVKEAETLIGRMLIDTRRTKSGVH